jgi:hypothetical protein
MIGIIFSLLIAVRKWLLVEGDDSLSTTICIPSSRFNHRRKSKLHLNKIIKRKRFNHQKSYSKTTSIMNWFYQFIKHIFIVYDKSPLHDRTTNDTTQSIMTCATCQFEHVHARINTYTHLILRVDFISIDCFIEFNQH